MRGNAQIEASQAVTAKAIGAALQHNGRGLIFVNHFADDRSKEGHIAWGLKKGEREWCS
jgi:hypothetical protein